MPVPPKKNSAYIIYTALVSQADTKIFKSVPTLAAGDFKVVIDGAASANLATLPTNTPGGVFIKISLSAGEMNGDNISVACIDAAGAEWCDQLLNIQTSVRNIDDLAYPATSGRSMVVDAAGLVDANAVKVGPTGAGTAQGAGDLKALIDAVDNFVDTEITDIQNRLPAALVSGRIDASVGAMAANTMNASALATDAVTEIQSGLATAAALTTVDDLLDTEIPALTTSVAAIKAKTDNLPASPANETTLTTVAGYLDTEIAAIKIKTDNLPTDPADASDIAARFTTLDTNLALVATPANVLTQVNSALDAAGAELASIPGVAAGLRLKINFIFQYLGLKRTTTVTTETMLKNDNSTPLGTSAVSNDGTTATHSKVA